MASDDLRARIAVGTPLIYSDERHQAKVAALQSELDRLHALLREHDSCRTCGHERRRHGRDPIIRRDWCSDCRTDQDLHTFEEESLS